MIPCDFCLSPVTCLHYSECRDSSRCTIDGNSLTPESASRTMEGKPIDPKPVRPVREASHESVKEELRIALIMSAVQAELERARRKHPVPMHNAHEAYGVLAEEVHEFFLEVISNDKPKRRKEAIQVAAMACRYLLECDLDG